MTMKTEQELKDELEDIFFDALTDKSNYTDKVDPENDGRWQWKVYELCADELIKRGYGDVSEYKAEIERLRQEVRDTDKMARNTIEQYKNNYDNAFERLKAQEREIERLKAENDTNMQYIRMMGIQSHIKTSNEQVKQAQIDVLNKVKEKLDSAPNGWAYTTYIDELIEEVENDK